MKATKNLPDTTDGSAVNRIVADVYVDYAKELRTNNSLDFDDLLVYGVKLLKNHPQVVRKTRHVLVDELSVRIGISAMCVFLILQIMFSQDTNSIQFELMELMASASKCISIVGDPDQSSTVFLRVYSLPILIVFLMTVYGWRSAGARN